MHGYLLNAWYAAAHSHEVTDKPLTRTLLEQPVVLFRSSDGSVVALEDRCPHRFAPLSRGRIHDGQIECGYHGLRFDAAGRCSHNPHGPVPPRAKVRPFVAVERHGFIWFWPGDPAKADPAKIVDFSYLMDRKTFTTLPGYLRVKANYQLIVDNLLDLSHALFLHPHFFVHGQPIEEQLAATRTKTLVEGDHVTAWRLRKAVPPNRPTQEIFGFGPDLVDSRTHMHWFPPSTINFDIGSCLTGTSEAEGLSIPQAHLITPETEFSSHYFVAAARNMKRDDPLAGAKFFTALDLAFREQDEPMIEAVQQRMGAVSDLNFLGPLLLGTDSAAVAARRILARLIEVERGSRDSVTPGTDSARNSAV